MYFNRRAFLHIYIYISIYLTETNNIFDKQIIMNTLLCLFFIFISKIFFRLKLVKPKPKCTVINIFLKHHALNIF